ncbi:alpha/beta hydrolase [Tissierella sp. MSJ-40]|uniref:Alpha/beta hydrolase n=1 Tax=Tissierella simiarum TaxID=2841534 RepID=A0ABS6ECJ9_9FIRM|nr:alpha/beta hydrolase [Tissierella simiarum]MBU5440256.1 alpha/beta hydrolase [Tissierella simiarum]
MPFFNTSDEVNIYYEITGEGIPIVFIHGWTEDHNSFRIQQKKLSKEFKVITYDLRGHGISDRPEKGLTLDRFALDLKELIDYLDIDKVVLVGWSMGASVIFEYVNHFGLHKLSKTCIVDMGPKAINGNDWNLGLYHGKYTIEDSLKDLTIMCNNWMEFAEKFIKSIAPYLDDRQLKISLDKIARNTPHIMYSMWISISIKDYRDVLEKISIPTLIIYGEKSTLYSVDTAEYMSSRITNSEVIIFENCTHLLVMENPIKFNKVIKEFVEN